MYGNRHSSSYLRSPKVSTKAILVHFDVGHANLSKTNNCPFFVADFIVDASEEYGNIYQLRLLTDNRVRGHLLLIKHQRTWAADNHNGTPSHQGILTTVGPILCLILTSCLSIKAILATQFDSFEKGKLCPISMAEKSPIKEKFRGIIPIPIQVISGRRCFQC